MDRIEAYKLLTQEMTRLAEQIKSTQAASYDDFVELDVQGVSSPSYSVELTVERTPDNRFTILGRIHDNSSYQFVLLEERLEFDIPTGE